jgi:hypothetical protein
VASSADSNIRMANFVSVMITGRAFSLASTRGGSLDVDRGGRKSECQNSTILLVDLPDETGGRK